MVGLSGRSARADFIQFDPDGPGPNPSQTIGGLDFAVGNALAQNGVTAIRSGPGSTFQLYYQATLAGVINTSGITITPPGLNGNAGAPAFEITVVASATEVVTSVGTNTASFALAPVQSPTSFVELWFDSAVNANNLVGTGFNNGTRILLGSPSALFPSSGNFTLSTDASGGLVIQNFDQFGANNYPGITSVVGSGSALVGAGIASFNSAFFNTPVFAASFNTSNITPFLQTDPSAMFAGLPGGVPPAIVPMLGVVNGVVGPDFQFQADANMSFSTVPEPTSITLLAIGLFGTLGRAALRSRKRSA